MKHRLFVVILALLCLLVTGSACHGPWEKKNNHRTVIIYMEANNNLSQWSHTNLNDLLVNASDVNMENGRLMLFMNTAKSKKLYEIKPYRSDKGGYRGDTVLLEQYQFATALEKNAMREVLQDAMQAAPANEYALILWSHSTGWLPQDIDIKESSYIRAAGAPEMPITKNFGMDGRKSISYLDIARAIEGLGLDMMMIDACFGTCVEALYDLRNVCDYVVASPIEILGAGYPYADLMSVFFDKDLTIPMLGEAVCRAYMQYYRQYTFQGTPYPYGAISLIDLSKMDALAQATHDVMQECQDTPIDHKKVQALENRYYSLYYDFYHYIQQLTKEESSDIFTTFARCFEQCVVYHDHSEKLYSNLNGYSTRALENSYGLSSYIPRPGHSSYFDRCDQAYFETNWAKYIYSY